MQGIVFANYGQLRELNCTEREREVFDIIRSICDDANLDSERLELVRKSEEYVSVVMPSEKYGNLDVARIKYTNRAKWIKICPKFDRIRIDSPEDVAKLYAEAVREAYRINLDFL